MKKILVLLVFSILSFQSYAQKSVKEMTQMQQVMKIHDKIMEQDMGKTVRLIGKLETKLKSASSSDTYESAITGLKAANKTMVDWMQGFGQRFSYEEMYKGKTLSQQKKEWLNEEQEKLFAMQEQINASIENAESLLNKK